jgi:cell division protein FtsL
MSAPSSSEVSVIRKRMTAGRNRYVLRAAAIAAMLAAAGIFHVVNHGRVVQAGYDLGKIERRHRELLRENEQLKMERATLSAASRLEVIARDRLGLQQPDARQVVTIRMPSDGSGAGASDNGAGSAKRDSGR